MGLDAYSFWCLDVMVSSKNAWQRPGWLVVGGCWQRACCSQHHTRRWQLAAAFAQSTRSCPHLECDVVYRQHGARPQQATLPVLVLQQRRLQQQPSTAPRCLQGATVWRALQPSWHWALASSCSHGQALLPRGAFLAGTYHCGALPVVQVQHVWLAARDHQELQGSPAEEHEALHVIRL